MGVWGAGNFQNDAAAEQLVAVCDALTNETDMLIHDDEAIDPGACGSDLIMANLEMLLALARLGRRSSHSYIDETLRPKVLPSVETLRQWQNRYLSAWDANTDSVLGVEGFMDERRRVIATTFDRIIALASMENG